MAQNKSYRELMELQKQSNPGGATGGAASSNQMLELILNRKLSERRVFPAIDLAKSGTRRDDLLLTPEEQECVSILRSSFIGNRAEEATDSVIGLFSQTKTNGEFVKRVIRHQWSY